MTVWESFYRGWFNDVGTKPFNQRYSILKSGVETSLIIKKKIEA